MPRHYFSTHRFSQMKIMFLFCSPPKKIKNTGHIHAIHLQASWSYTPPAAPPQLSRLSKLEFHFYLFHFFMGSNNNRALFISEVQVDEHFWNAHCLELHPDPNSIYPYSAFLFLLAIYISDLILLLSCSTMLSQLFSFFRHLYM